LREPVPIPGFRATPVAEPTEPILIPPAGLPVRS